MDQDRRRRAAPRAGGRRRGSASCPGPPTGIRSMYPRSSAWHVVHLAGLKRYSLWFDLVRDSPLGPVDERERQVHARPCGVRRERGAAPRERAASPGPYRTPAMPGPRRPASPVPTRAVHGPPAARRCAASGQAGVDVPARERWHDIAAATRSDGEGRAPPAGALHARSARGGTVGEQHARQARWRSGSTAPRREPRRQASVTPSGPLGGANSLA